MKLQPDIISTISPRREVMGSGKLNRRILIQQQTTTRDGYGQQLAAWSTLYQCWARIEVQRSQLVYETSAFVEKVTHRITFRWPPSVVIEPNMRIQYQDASANIVHTYNIEALLNDNQANRWLIALCYEINGDE
jgi:SPP1 family predicted phage head-tail adaptor